MRLYEESHNVKPWDIIGRTIAWKRGTHATITGPVKQRYTYTFSWPWNDHNSVTELMWALWGLHWLPIRARIQYKILLLVYKAFTNPVLQHIWLI